MRFAPSAFPLASWRDSLCNGQFRISLPRFYDRRVGVKFEKIHLISQLHREKRAGIYHLVISLPRARRLRAGKLGLKSYPSGYYVYTGSARRGLAMRILRHLRKEKTRHWHIDWLTQVSRIEEIWVNVHPKSAECECHQRVIALPGARTLIPRFGSSDCRCPSHLAYFQWKPELKGVGFQSTRGKRHRRFGIPYLP